MALDHDADDATVTTGDLTSHILTHLDLLFGLLAAVGMAEVDHDAGRQPCLDDLLSGDIDALGVIVGAVPTAQDDVGIGIAGGGEDGRLPVLGDRHEHMRPGRRMDGVDGDLHVTVGAVLEAHWTRQARGEFPMALTLGGAGADRPPAHQVRDVLGTDQVQILGAGRHPHLGQVQEQLTGQRQTLVDLEAAVQVRVVDQALPADGGPGLFKIDPHDHHQVGGQGLAHRQQPFGIFHGSLGVVNRAGTDHHQQAIVLAVKDTLDRPPGLEDRIGSPSRDRETIQERPGGLHLSDSTDAQIVGLV